MLQYLSAGVPTIVTPVGMNREVLSLGRVGIAAEDSHDWYDALILLYKNQKKGLEYGRNGRHIVEKYFSIDIVSDRLAEAFTSIV
jgi:glycosyltransferase involved in cell wall biosynthesis